MNKGWWKATSKDEKALIVQLLRAYVGGHSHVQIATLPFVLNEEVIRALMYPRIISERAWELQMKLLKLCHECGSEIGNYYWAVEGKPPGTYAMCHRCFGKHKKKKLTDKKLVRIKI